VRRPEREFRFLGHDRRRRIAAAAHESRDGAEVTTGADHDRVSIVSFTIHAPPERRIVSTARPSMTLAPERCNRK
jgi:hypothetical protein